MALVTAPGQCHAQVLIDIAKRLGASGDADAFALIDRVARDEISRSQGRYEEAIDLIGLACQRLDGTRAQQYVALLKGEYKAKRNLIKALDTLQFGDAGRCGAA